MRKCVKSTLVLRRLRTVTPCHLRANVGTLWFRITKDRPSNEKQLLMPAVATDICLSTSQDSAWGCSTLWCKCDTHSVVCFEFWIFSSFSSEQYILWYFWWCWTAAATGLGSHVNTQEASSTLQCAALLSSGCCRSGVFYAFSTHSGAMGWNCMVKKQALECELELLQMVNGPWTLKHLRKKQKCSANSWQRGKGPRLSDSKFMGNSQKKKG